MFVGTWWRSGIYHTAPFLVWDCLWQICLETDSKSHCPTAGLVVAMDVKHSFQFNSSMAQNAHGLSSLYPKVEVQTPCPEICLLKPGQSLRQNLLKSMPMDADKLLACHVCCERSSAGTGLDGDWAPSFWEQSVSRAGTVWYCVRMILFDWALGAFSFLLSPAPAKPSYKGR